MPALFTAVADVLAPDARFFREVGPADGTAPHRLARTAVLLAGAQFAAQARELLALLVGERISPAGDRPGDRDGRDQNHPEEYASHGAASGGELQHEAVGEIGDDERAETHPEPVERRLGAPTAEGAAGEQNPEEHPGDEGEEELVVNTYLAVKARYYKAAGDIPLALRYINEVLETERLPEDIQFKADILKEQGRLEEVMALYDELYRTLTKRRGTSFLRQVNQLRTLHELHEKELKETELKEAGLRIARKQDLLVFILSISVVLSILLYISFLYYRHLRSLKNQLQREKDLLLESQRRLMKEKTRAEEASLMKSAFLANMSHEIRTPLNAIVGFSSLLVEPSTDAKEREEYSSIIRNNTDLMLNLVNDVLDLSRMETGDLHFNIKDYPLLECCQMALESVRYRMPDRVKLTFSPAGEPIVVHVDNLRLQQLLTNLLTNAAKFTEKGEINLSFQLAPDREKVCIAVTDTGAGIPLEKQAAVFNRFEKLDDYKPGAGLGLSICLLIAERLNGSLSIDSSYTDGARFVLILSCEIDSSIYNPPIEV